MRFLDSTLITILYQNELGTASERFNGVYRIRNYCYNNQKRGNVNEISTWKNMISNYTFWHICFSFNSTRVFSPHHSHVLLFPSHNPTFLFSHSTIRVIRMYKLRFVEKKNSEASSRSQYTCASPLVGRFDSLLSSSSTSIPSARTHGLIKRKKTSAWLSVRRTFILWARTKSLFEFPRVSGSVIMKLNLNHTLR